MAKFAYYEDGNARVFTMPEVKRMYDALVGQDQKNNGTTFFYGLQKWSICRF